MLLGCYYRCPIEIEPGDREHPRFFVLAQVVEYNEIADAVRVEMHDLLGSKAYYEDLFQHNVFRADAIARCEAIPGGVVRGSWGKGIIVKRAKESATDDLPYWYWIKLSNGKTVKACETDLQIEYSQMNYAPEKQLESYEFQHPTWFLNHLKVSRNRHLVNNATYGFRVLAGCRAYLLPHQISTVARCFETLPVRYMLADEVGLGKTVEACSILSILAKENQNLRSLIIVPSALVTQWQNELHYKYSLTAAISSAHDNLCLLPLEDVDQAQAVLNADWDLCIVDETHRLLANSSWYEKIEKISRKVDHMLLLSATPIQDRNEEYHRLLVLLNPAQYGDMSSERFAWLVKKQKRIQKTVNQQLGRLNRYEEYRDIIVEKLKEVSTTLSDPALDGLIDKIDLSSEDNGLDRVKQALAYICEFYRIERRVVRNRRQLISQKMAKRTLCAIPYQPLSLNENYNEISAIQSTLAYLSENGDDSEEYVVKTAIPLLSALFSSPWAFKAALYDLDINSPALQASADEWIQQAENEHAVVNAAIDEDPDLIKGRLMRAIDYLDQESDIANDATSKVVVFTAHNATLRAFLSLFNSRYLPMGIRAVPFGKDLSRAELEDSVYAFQNDPQCRVIVCDETGGEGRNFQNASAIIHLDLPWDANTLEQRIGRLDRLGRDSDMDVLSVVFYAEGTIEEQLFHIWKDGMKLFDQSLSGLEIVTGELNRLIVDALLDDYDTGLINAFDDILEQADEMRESVEEEQDFDLGATLYRPLSQGVDHVLRMYAEEDDNLFATAMMSWGHQAGLYAERPTSSGLIEFRESSFSVNAARQSLFIPPNWKHYSISSIVLREGKILGSFNRKTAAMREDILFFAPGDAVYDSIISNAVGCSRGRCAAIKTKGPFRYDGIVYIFNAEPEIDTLLEQGIGLETLAQYRMYLPLKQIIIPIPLTIPSRDVPEKDVIDLLLAMPLRAAEHMGRRSAAKGITSPLEQFIMKTPPTQWEPLVKQCTKTAYRLAQKELHEESDLISAKSEMQRVLNGYRAECVYFGREDNKAKSEEKKFQYTLEAMKKTAPVLDAVCFLRVRENG